MHCNRNSYKKEYLVERIYTLQSTLGCTHASPSSSSSIHTQLFPNPSLSGDFSLSPRRHFPNSILRNGAVIIVVTTAIDDDDFQSREQGVVKMMSAFVTCTKERKVELENDMHSTSSNNNSSNLHPFSITHGNLCNSQREFSMQKFSKQPTTNPN